MNARDGGPEDDYGDLRWHADRTSFGSLLYLACLPELAPTSYRVWVVIRAHENRKLGFAWPSRRRIADLAGIRTVETVDRHLKRLEDLGLLLVGSGREAGRSNRYKTIAPAELVERGRAHLYNDATKSSDKKGRSLDDHGTGVPERPEDPSPDRHDTQVPERSGEDREVEDGEVGRRGRDVEVGSSPHGAAPRAPRPDQNENDGRPAGHPPPGKPDGARRREAALDDAADRYWDGEPVDE